MEGSDSKKTVTALKAQKNGQNVNVYINDQFAFGMDLELIYQYGVRQDQQLTELEVSQLKSASQINQLYQKAVKYISLRPRSEKEVCNWMKKKKIDTPIQNSLLKKLKDKGWINDVKFAQWWISQRLEFKPRGAMKLRQELMQKGIPSKIIDQCLSELPDQEENIKELARKKIRLIKVKPGDNQIKVRKKLSDYLLRKGYKYQEIKTVVDELL